MMILENFHFLRPVWLLALLPIALLLWQQRRRRYHNSGWHGVIDAELLPHLLVERLQQRGGAPLWPVALSCCLAVIALAGPAWQKIPQPVQRSEDALVILYDLSHAMLVEDIKPSRLVRSQQKIHDLLQQRLEGTTALIAYAGDEHVVAPLTEDRATIANLLPALDPDIMPVAGNHPAPALRRGIRLLRDAGHNRGRLLLITAGVSDRDRKAMSSAIADTHYRLSILGVGTGEGGPIPGKSGFLKDDSGSILIAGLDSRPLRQLAAVNGGAYSDLTLSGIDLERLLQTQQPGGLRDSDELRQLEQWQDMGYWLLPLLVPVLLLAFRRGLVVCVALWLTAPAPVQAFEWRDLWLTPDQQAAKLFEQDKPAAAAGLFQNRNWRAGAHYRAGDYDSAGELFRQGERASDWYNLGNSLAFAGQLEQAIAAYDRALEMAPAMEDAVHNKAILEQMREQQNRQQEQQSQQQEQQNQQQEQQQNQQQSDQQQRQQADSNNQPSEPSEPSESGKNPQQNAPSDNSAQPSQAPQLQPDGPDTDRPQQAQAGPDDKPEKQQQAQAGPDDEPEKPQQAPPRDADEQERDLANEQWLRRIPDDPSGLLRRKFKYESQQRSRRGPNPA